MTGRFFSGVSLHGQHGGKPQILSHRDCLNQGQARIPILPSHGGLNPIFGDVDRVINPCHPLIYIRNIYYHRPITWRPQPKAFNLLLYGNSQSFRALGHWQLESARNVLTACKELKLGFKRPSLCLRSTSVLFSAFSRAGLSVQTSDGCD